MMSGLRDIPTIKSKSPTPKCANVSIVSAEDMRLKKLGERSMPATIYPMRMGCLRILVKAVVRMSKVTMMANSEIGCCERCVIKSVNIQVGAE
jgi:hypothetical protein